MSFLIVSKKYEKLFNLWLYTIIFLLISIIIVGGLTRLTDSGLSITKWELIKGILPPLSENEWNYYFDQYKTIPQYYLLNNNISLNDFKIIFYWEYIHRLLGRLIGLSFILPLFFFLYKKIIKVEYIKYFFMILFLILFQGLIGWFMVSSGLTDNVTVSHYRLSLHLFVAFTILSFLIWLTFISNSGIEKNFFKNLSRPNLINLYILLLYIQIIVGAFVSGLDAGRIYQTWPLMNSSYFPDDLVLKGLFSFDIFNSHSFVQFIHRNIAYTICIIYLFIGFFIFIKKKKSLYKPYLILFFIVLLQIVLGILTLTSGLNFFIASSHQISSILLVYFSLNLYFYSIE